MPETQKEPPKYNKELLEKHGILDDILLGCCYIGKDKRPTEEVRKTIIDYVIEGAKKLKQRPGRVSPLPDEGIHLDTRASKQFRVYASSVL